MGSIRPGPLPRPVCLLSRVPALPASGPSPDQGQQCLLDCPGLHHHQSQVPKKYPCHSIRVHGRTLTPSSAHSVVLRPESPSSGDAEPRTTLLAAAPMVFSTDQFRDPDHCPRPAHRDSLSSGPLPLPRRLAPTWLVQGSRLLLDLRPPPAGDPASRQVPMDPTEQTPGTRDLSAQQPHGGEASSLSPPPRDPQGRWEGSGQRGTPTLPWEPGPGCRRHV